MIVKSITSKSFMLRSFLILEKKWLTVNARTFHSPACGVNLLPPKRHEVYPKSTEILNIHQRRFSNQRDEITGPMTTQNFDDVCEDTIQSLSDYFEELVETCPHIKDYDVNYGDGVLTVKFGPPYGTYVINRQTPNQQIWLSSPTSGPKRYDFERGQWVYRHDGITLHQLLDREVGNIVRHDVHFSRCAYSGTQNGTAAAH